LRYIATAATALILLSSSVMFAAPKRYMIITNSAISRSEPRSSSDPTGQKLGFGSIIFSDKLIRNDTDFDFLEIAGEPPRYVPFEMTIEVPSVSLSHDKKSITTDSDEGLPLLYIPKDLLPVNSMYSFSEERILVKKTMLKDLYSLLQAAKKNGHTLFVANGFKDLQTRIREYEEAISRNPKQRAVPKPVFSSFATGLVIDITDEATGMNFEHEVKNDKAWKWLHENAPRYGFRSGGKTYRFEYSGEKSRRSVTPGPTFAETINERIEVPSICTIHVLKTATNKKASFMWVHHNEKSAGKTLKYALSEYKGHSLYISNNDKRNLYLSYGRRNYFIDPNRIFTARGVSKFLTRHHKSLSRKGRKSLTKRITDIRETILTSIDWHKNKYLIVLHSSRPGSDFSIEEFNRKNSYLTYTNPDHNPKNLFFTTSLQDYYFFKSKQFNVVYQRSIEDDGSLSIYAAKNNLPYINIEVEEGNDEVQKKMLDLAIECVNQQFKEKSL
jgi:hypothetical protein